MQINPSRNLILLILFLISACSRWEPAICNNGLRCPLGCTADGKACVEELCGNAKKDDGEDCDDGNNENKDGCDYKCELENRCGNGSLEPGEICDDGNIDPAEGCRADCQAEVGCGNKFIDPDEDCDDGNELSGDGCYECLTEVCGNGRVDPGESCDPPNTNPDNYCSESCEFNGECGNSHKAPREICDDGNLVSGDGCSSNCSSDESCGNGIIDVDVGEDCDCGTTLSEIIDPNCLGQINSFERGVCRPDCQAHCGDGRILGNELCDESSESPVFCMMHGNNFLGVAACLRCQPVYDNLCRIKRVIGNPEFADPSPANNGLTGILSTRIGDFFAVGEDGTILKLIEGVWAPEDIREPRHKVTLFDIGGEDGDSAGILAVGASGIILRRELGIWQNEAPSDVNEPLYGVWSSPSGDSFAVGARGTVVHRPAGMPWRKVIRDNVPTDEDLYDVWGSDSGDVFIVGSAGKILRKSGEEWIPMTLPAGYSELDLRSIWGIDKNDVYAVGRAGKILHFNGTSWRPMPSPTNKLLTDIWGSSATEIFAVGEEGTIIYYDGAHWSPVHSGTPRGLHGVWVMPKGLGHSVIAVGDKRTIISFDYETPLTFNYYSGE
jgi:cysteine-rich repeat protein